MKKLIPFAFIVLTGCAAKVGTTIQGENSHQAIGTGYTEMDSVEMAINTAEKHCSKTSKRPAIDELKTEYNGLFDEKTRDTADMVAGVAVVAGAWLPSLGKDTDYKTVAHFRCL